MIDTDREPTVAPAGGTAVPAPPAPVHLSRGTVWLAPTLSVPMGMALSITLGDEPNTIAAVMGTIASIALAPAPLGAILSWDFTEDDAPVPLTRENITRLLPWDEGGLEVAEEANALYAERYLRPFLQRAGLEPSLLMPTDGSTPPRKVSGRKHRRSSSASSRNGSGGRP